MSIVRQNAKRFGAREINFPVGKTLYHGSTSRLPNGFPTMKGGNWFATDPKQSILHALQGAHKIGENKKAYLYIYKVIQSPTVLKFNAVSNFNNFGKSIGYDPGYTGTLAFSNANKKMARTLCQDEIADGWWFPADQTQVMLCKPSKFLKFVKVLEIKPPPKGFIYIGWNNLKGEWSKNNINKFSTVPIKLNNIINTNQPSSSSIYVVFDFKESRKPVYFNVNGSRLNNINFMKPTYEINGKKYPSNLLKITNLGFKKSQIMADRIKAKTGVRPVKISQIKIPGKVNQTELNKKKALLNWKYRIQHPAKTKSPNLNASALYKNV